MGFIYPRVPVLSEHFNLVTTAPKMYADLHLILPLNIYLH